MGSLLFFPSSFAPAPLTRATAMLHGHRVKVTTINSDTKEHVTVLIKCYADNRDRTFDPKVNKNWAPCGFIDATHIFFEVPNAGGDWNDKIGTYYPKTGKWFNDRNADPNRVQAAFAIAHWLHDRTFEDTSPTWNSFREAEECGKCGAELTDPESQRRGYGPTCWGSQTGSQHQVKLSAAGMEAVAPGADVLYDHELENAKVDGAEAVLSAFGEGIVVCNIHQMQDLDADTFALLAGAVGHEMARRAALVNEPLLEADRQRVERENVIATNHVAANDNSFLES